MDGNGSFTLFGEEYGGHEHHWRQKIRLHP